MRLYIGAKTNIPDAVIDVLELRLNTGELINLDWDESEHGVVDGIYTARLKGLSGCLDGAESYEYLNGKIDMFREPVKIADVMVYSEESDENSKFQVTNLVFEDDGYVIEMKFET